MAVPDKYDKQHLRNLGLTEKQITKIFDSAIKEAAAIGASLHDFNPGKPFSFSDYPQTKARIEKMIKELQKKVETVIVNGTRSEWTLANNKNNALCDWVFGDNKYRLSKEQERKYYSNNDKALEAFLQRKTNGLNLSDRVWNYTGQFKEEIEAGLDLGIRNGLPAAEMARDLKQYLKYPDKLFRRVRDEHGQLHLSKAAKAFHPGAGVYRSSYKNALRLARTENNMAYHTADYESWQQFDFVVGIEVQLSNNHPVSDICDNLKGKYPKTFKFTGWHPQCRCHVVAVLKTEEEIMADGERIMNGEEPKTGSVNEVKDVPENFKQWVEKNRDRIEKANNRGTLPYFIKDNYKEGNINNKFIWEAEKRVKTEAEKADIQKRWDERKAGKLDEVIQMLNDERIKYNEVMMHQRLLPESEIISRVGGGDLTKGSCSSLAFTYAGNKCGFDVLDFRDGSSRAKFSSAATINNIADKVGGIVVKNTSDFAKATDLLKHVKEGKEYYFTCGKHAAIVRKTATGYEYLELQSSIENGFKELTTMKLKSRFGAKQSHTFHGHKYETRDCIIDIELLQKDASFRKLLGYINTPESEQKKGKKGSIK